MSKPNQWMKARHRVITTILRSFLKPYIRWKYGITVAGFPEEGNRPYLILMNHQTGFDQFFVATTFRQPIYYLATEDIFSMGWVSRLIQWLVAPIPIRKQTTDIQAVKNCIRVAREGGSICLFPEGNRTFHGKTVYMNPSVASLAQKLGLPIALLRLEGGYGVQPRWSNVVRKGKMRCYVSRVVEPEEYKAMSRESLFELIRAELTVDEALVTGQFRHSKNAEFLERAIYTCPRCGLSTFESSGDIIRCTKCDQKIRHLPTKELEGIDCDFPHRFVADWYQWQEEFVNALDPLTLTEVPVYQETVRISRVHLYKYKELLKKEVPLCLYGDRIVLDGREFHFGEISAVVVLGKNKLNIYSGQEILQLKGNKRFNALKYVHFFHRYKNRKAGDNHGKFLGL